MAQKDNDDTEQFVYGCLAVVGIAFMVFCWLCYVIDLANQSFGWY
jgi:hypothetical protein